MDGDVTTATMDLVLTAANIDFHGSCIIVNATILTNIDSLCDHLLLSGELPQLHRATPPMRRLYVVQYLLQFYSTYNERLDQLSSKLSQSQIDVVIKTEMTDNEESEDHDPGYSLQDYDDGGESLSEEDDSAPLTTPQHGKLEPKHARKATRSSAIKRSSQDASESPDIQAKKWKRGPSEKPQLRVLTLPTLKVEKLKPLSCEKCDKIFVHKWELECHIATCTTQVKQEVCETTTPEIPEMSAAPDRQFTCKSCDREFTNQTALFEHTRLEHRKAFYKCSVCEETFKWRNTLRKHVKKMHSGEKTADDQTSTPSPSREYLCKSCDRVFTNQTALYEHTRLEHRQIFYKCTLCKESFKWRHTLRKHMKKLHAGQTPDNDKHRYDDDIVSMNGIFWCVHCSKQYKYKQILKDHLRTAHGLGEHLNCTMCTMTFKHRTSLTYHIKSKHQGVRYRCNIPDCGKQYKVLKNLKIHQRSAHKSQGQPPSQPKNHGNETRSGKPVINPEITGDKTGKPDNLMGQVLTTQGYSEVQGYTDTTPDLDITNQRLSTSIGFDESGTAQILPALTETSLPAVLTSPGTSLIADFTAQTPTLSGTEPATNYQTGPDMQGTGPNLQDGSPITTVSGTDIGSVFGVNTSSENTHTSSNSLLTDTLTPSNSLLESGTNAQSNSNIPLDSNLQHSSNMPPNSAIPSTSLPELRPDLAYGYQVPGYSSTAADYTTTTPAPDYTTPAPDYTTTYLCEKCNSYFTEMTDLERHNAECVITPEQLLTGIKCKLCEKRFKSESQLWEHDRLIHRQMLYPCKLCDQSFKWRQTLKKHMNQVHPGIIPPGDKKTRLAFHISVDASGLFTCNYCPRQYRYKHVLKDHLRTSHGIGDDYMCVHCGETFKHRNTHKIHVTSLHEGIRYRCNYPGCDKFYRSKQYYKTHNEKIHGNSDSHRPDWGVQQVDISGFRIVFGCNRCDQEFSDKSELDGHKDLCTGSNSRERNMADWVSCKVCAHSFSSDSKLWEHNRIVHKGVMYSCGFCGQSFKWRATLKNHVDKCHKT